MLLTILFITSSGYGACRFAPSIIVFSEGFSSGNPLPAGWTSITPAGFASAPWENTSSMCGPMYVNTVACSEYAGGAVYEILESPPITIPPIPPGQDLWLRFNYGISGPVNQGNYLEAMLSVLVNGNWSPYTTIMQPVSNIGQYGNFTLGSVLLSLNNYIQNATALKLRFIHVVDTASVALRDSAAVFIDSVLLYIDTTSGPLDTMYSDTTDKLCCTLSYAPEGALQIRPDDYWWTPPEQPYSTDNWTYMCNECSDSTIYSGVLTVNGNVVDSAIYVFPPDTCIPITWDTVALDYGPNNIEFELTPISSNACSGVSVATSVYIFEDTTATDTIPPDTSSAGGPPVNPWCPIEPCIVDINPIFIDPALDDLINIVIGNNGGIDINLGNICDIPPVEFDVIKVKLKVGSQSSSDTIRVIATIYDPPPPPLDTIAFSSYEFLLSDVLDIDLTFFPSVSEITDSSRIRIVFENLSGNNSSIYYRYIPLEVVDVDDALFRYDSNDEWRTFRESGIFGFPYIGIAFIDTTTTNFYEVEPVSGNSILMNMVDRKAVLKGRGHFMVFDITGKLMLKRRVDGEAVVNIRNLSPGVYIYRFGTMRGKFIIK